MTKTKYLREPIFYEALAAAAKCTPADAVEHFEALVVDHDHHEEEELVGDFLTEFAR